MRGVLVWMVEQLCRPLDTKVCAIANSTDDVEHPFPTLYRGV